MNSGHCGVSHVLQPPRLDLELAHLVLLYLAQQGRPKHCDEVHVFQNYVGNFLVFPNRFTEAAPIRERI